MFDQAGSGLTFALLLLQCGPPLVLWVTVIAPHSFLILVTLGSAFYWASALIAIAAALQGFIGSSSSLGTYALVVTVAVATEEACRCGLFWVYRRVVHVLTLAASKNPGVVLKPQDETLLAVAFGFGHATAHSLVFSVTWLPLASGKGSLPVSHCSCISWAPAAAFTSLGFFMLHTGIMVIAFDGLGSGRLLSGGAVAAVHLGAALLTLLNLQHDSCAAVAATEIMLGMAAVVAAGVVIRRRVSCSREYSHVTQSELPGHPDWLQS